MTLVISVGAFHPSYRPESPIEHPAERAKVYPFIAPTLSKDFNKNPSYERCLSQRHYINATSGSRTSWVPRVPHITLRKRFREYQNAASVPYIGGTIVEQPYRWPMGATRRDGRRGGEPIRTTLEAESLPTSLLTTSVTVMLPEVVKVWLGFCCSLV